jgi:hypothetical protein
MLQNNELQKRCLLIKIKMSDTAAGQSFLQFPVELVTTPIPKQQYYRRELPSSCIAFSSNEAKILFANALSQSNLLKVETL